MDPALPDSIETSATADRTAGTQQGEDQGRQTCRASCTMTPDRPVGTPGRNGCELVKAHYSRRFPKWSGITFGWGVTGTIAG